MNKSQIKKLRVGDIITWQSSKGWNAYGRIAEKGTLMCDYIIGDGDSHIGKDDIFYSSEPSWVEECDISLVSNKTSSYYSIRRKFNELEFREQMSADCKKVLGCFYQRDFMCHERTIFSTAFTYGFNYAISLSKKNKKNDEG